MYFRNRNGNVILRNDEKTIAFFDTADGIWKKAEVIPENAEEITDEEAMMYETAYFIAKKAHEGQKDKGGNDYFTHPVTVASTAQGSMVSVITGLLHDTVEDTDVTLESLKEAGMNEAVLACVDCTTHRENESREAYLKRLSFNTDAIYVKLADLAHNSDLSRIREVREKDLKRVEKYHRETAMLKEILKTRQEAES